MWALLTRGTKFHQDQTVRTLCRRRKRPKTVRVVIKFLRRGYASSPNVEDLHFFLYSMRKVFHIAKSCIASLILDVKLGTHSPKNMPSARTTCTTHGAKLWTHRQRKHSVKLKLWVEFLHCVFGFECIKKQDFMHPYNCFSARVSQTDWEEWVGLAGMSPVATHNSVSVARVPFPSLSSKQKSRIRNSSKWPRLAGKTYSMTQRRSFKRPRVLFRAHTEHATWYFKSWMERPGKPLKLYI